MITPSNHAPGSPCKTWSLWWWRMRRSCPVEAKFEAAKTKINNTPQEPTYPQKNVAGKMVVLFHRVDMLAT